jgi:hypothetical protein
MTSIKISELQSSTDNIMRSGYFPISDSTDLSYTQGMGRTLKVPSTDIYNMCLDKNILTKTQSYVISPKDYNAILRFDNSSGSDIQITVPSNNSSLIIPGYNIEIVRYNLGNVQMIADTGVTIYSSTGLYLNTRYSAATLTKIQNDIWILQGDLTTSSNAGT